MNEKHDSPIAREGYPFIILTAALTLAAFFLGMPRIAFLLLLATGFVVWFFRNPERNYPGGEKLVISPADGKVIRIEEIGGHELLPGASRKISIFMNVFSVHVNRFPYSGRIEAIRYDPGKFLSANLDKASSDNERNAVLIRTEEGRLILIIQIAGLVARRIVCWVKEGMSAGKGERFGMIRFGSRVEVLLPADTDILVKVGDNVRAGETPIGGLS
ncbi:MAG: phosphatidylserine decarboxylase [Syntrophaceae bacterium PtaB.Bin095]|jgi:phosphatidylserine decarboxylase|nr:MAG: phosphatidylserine decarboxylase [Syntrophaceae bacterium PtaB.Bin095]